MDHVTTIYFLVGVSIVLVFAINYFNYPSYKFAEEDKNSSGDQEDLMLEPALPKYLTVRFEYNLYMFAYVLVTEIIYVLLVLFLPNLMPEETLETINSLIPTQQNIVLATLIVTGIAPNLPYIRQLLERSKLYLHDKAQIPGKGRNVYQQLKNKRPHYTKSEIINVLGDERYAHINEQNQKERPDLLEADFSAETWTLDGRWAKLSYLLSYVNQWADKPLFRSYINNRELQRTSIDRAYNDLQQLMVTYKRGELSEHDRSRLHSRLDTSLHRTYRLISCLLYLAGKTDAAVDGYLDQLGYAASERNDFPIPWGNLVFVVAVIIGSITVGGLAAWGIFELNILPFKTEIDTHKIFRWVGFAVPFITIPVLMVLLIKRYLSSHCEAWPVVTEKSFYKKISDRPWHIYAIVVFVAFIGGGIVLFAISAILSMAKNEPLIDPLLMLRQAFVWSGIVFVTAGFAAYRLDSSPNPERSKLGCCALQSAGFIFQGLATSFAAYVAYMHTFGDGKINPLNLPEASKGTLVVYCLIAFMLGVSLYSASGFGKLRQRRKIGRRRIVRPVQIHSAEESFIGSTMNVSNGGALIESQEVTPQEGDIIGISAKEGEVAEGQVVKVQGNYLHIKFENESAWLAAMNELEIPSFA